MYPKTWPVASIDIGDEEVRGGGNTSKRPCTGVSVNSGMAVRGGIEGTVGVLGECLMRILRKFV